MLVGLGCPQCGEVEFCDGVTSCYVCEYQYPHSDGEPAPVCVEVTLRLCGACSRGAHADCSGWCFCTCEANR